MGRNCPSSRFTSAPTGNMLAGLAVQEGWLGMFRHRTTLRWFTAAYMAALMPFCCCTTSVFAASPVPPPPSDHAEHGLDDGHRGAASAGHHHETPDLQGQQAPCGPNHPCDPGSNEHQGDCDCGCSIAPAEFTLEAPPAAPLTLATASMFVPIIEFGPLRQRAVIQTPPQRDRRSTSLLQLHCALIV